MAKQGQKQQTAMTNFWRTARLVTYGIIILISVQLYLNEPERRPKVLCLPVYKIGGFFWVDIPELFLPREHKMLIEHVNDMEGFYFSCKKTTAKWPFFSEEKASPVSLPHELKVPDSLKQKYDKAPKPD